MNKKNKIELELQNIKQMLSEQQAKPLSFPEACNYLGISKAYLYKLTCLKKISYFKPNGKLIYFLKSDLDSFLLRGKHKSEYEIEAEAENIIKRKGA